MEQLSAIKAQIYDIGRQMVNCDRRCEGVGNDKEEGVLPRCLIFEVDRRPTDRGSVIVGINPGQSGHNERQFYIDNGRSYDQVLAYWDKRIREGV
ncbi:MAG: hypothetical protein M1358_25160 [Chloroflexi bacterium]|nr:hypothetical protein [Chloroflexota bacterium]